MKTRKKNPDGLHVRYKIKHADGTRVRKGEEYFVLHLNAIDEPHRLACLRAVNEYADAIEHYIPKLAKDIRRMWPRERKSLSLAKSDGSFYSDDGEPTQ